MTRSQKGNRPKRRPKVEAVPNWEPTPWECPDCGTEPASRIDMADHYCQKCKAWT